MKKIIALLLCLTMLSLTGCSLLKKKEADTDADTDNSSDIVIEKEEKKENSINPLTGLEIDKDKLDYRPVGVMINNINIAQPVQTGVNKADIVYETEVEGGITRLLAIFKDITAVNQLGTVRSARYPYVDLSLGHDAVYIHCGQDPKYCAPHLKDIDDISIGPGVCGGKRIPNGLASEHTLYTFGDKLLEGIKDKKIRTTADNNDFWQDFAKEGEEVSLTDGTANKISVSFSTSYKTVFNYDTNKQKYTRSFGTTVRTDYVTKDTTDVKNLFVLLTNIRDYSDGYHRQVDLIGGDGYYFSNGSYAKIKWSKGDAKSAFRFTDLNGNKLKVNAGNSWVCIADKGTSQPVIE